MNPITPAQLAELLIGIARAQQAIIDAVESQKPGFKGTHLAPALDAVAKTRVTGRPVSLLEFPARVLVQCQSRGGPGLEQVTRDLEALLNNATAPAAAAPNGPAVPAVPAAPKAVAPAARPAPPAPAAAAPVRPAAPAPAAPSDKDAPDSLDMT
jgi:hypothetical protein